MKPVKRISFFVGLIICFLFAATIKVNLPFLKASSQTVILTPNGFISLGYINGLNTPEDRSLLQLENLISLVEQSRVAINSEVLITPTPFIDKYELFHNPSQEDFELG